MYVHWACMYTAHTCSGAGTRAVPYRGRAPRFANHGSVLNACKFIAKIDVRFMDRSLNVHVCKTFHDKINVRFMD